MTNYQTIIFDLDGTLTDSQEGIFNSLIYAFEKMRLPLPQKADLRKFIGPPLSQSFQDFYGLSQEQTQLAIRYYRDYFARQGWKENRLFPGVKSLLSDLKASGKTLLVASSKPQVFVKQILDYFEITSYFSYIAGADLDDRRSHKAQVLAHVLEEAKLTDKGQAIMVGDRRYDVEGAAANGLACIGLLLGFGSKEELETAGALSLAQDIQDLRKLLL